MARHQTSTQTIRLLSPRLDQLTHTFSLIRQVVQLLFPVVHASRLHFLLSLLHRAGAELVSCGAIISPGSGFRPLFPDYPSSGPPGFLPISLLREHLSLPYCCFCGSSVASVALHLPLCAKFILFLLPCTSSHYPFSLYHAPHGPCESCGRDLRACHCIRQECRLCGSELCHCEAVLLSWLNGEKIFAAAPFPGPFPPPAENNVWKRQICLGLRLDDHQAVEWLRSLTSDGDVESNPGPGAGDAPSMDVDDHPVVRAMGRTPPCPLCSWISTQPNPSWEALLRHLNDFHAGQSDRPSDSWLRAARLRACPSCSFFGNMSEACGRCFLPLKRPRPTFSDPDSFHVSLPSSSAAAALPSSEPDWRLILVSKKGVLRSIPLSLKEDFFGVLAAEMNAVIQHPSAAQYLRLQAASRILLAPPVRGGKAHLQQFAKTLRVRMASWRAGDFHTLVSDFLKESPAGVPGSRRPRGESPPDSFIPDGPRRAIMRAVRDGELGKATRILNSVWGEVVHEVARAKLPALYPVGTPPPFMPFQEFVEADFTVDEVRQALRSFPRSSSGGLGGLMATHCSGEGPQFSAFLQALTSLASAFAWHRLPQEVSLLIAGAKLVLLPKKDGGLRPIAVGELVRRIAGKVLVARYQPSVANKLQPIQAGVACPGGMERIIHSIQLWAEGGPSSEALLQVDLKNAFGCLDRVSMLHSIRSHCPVFLPYALACYSGASSVHGWVLSAEVFSGVHQGDPLSPLFFSVAVHQAISQASALTSAAYWYLDDGTLIGSVDQLQAAVSALSASFAPLGLQFNCSKSLIWSPRSGILPLPAALSPFQVVPATLGITILGTPVGGASFEECSISTKVESLQVMFDRLLALNNLQAQSQILRSCLGPCKITHLLRTLSPSGAQFLSSLFAPRLRDAWESILGSPCSPGQWSLMTLPIKLGGLGVADPSLWWRCAQASSWIAFGASARPQYPVPPAVLSLLKELAVQVPSLGFPLVTCCGPGTWPDPGGPSYIAAWGDQSAWTSSLIQSSISAFNSNAPSRLRDLRVAQSAPHAGDWLTAPPFFLPTAVFSNTEWRAVLRFRAGIPVTSSPLCAACGQAASPSGDHFLSCPACGMWRRHNYIRDLVAALCRQAGWSTQLEVALPAEAGPSARPADVFIPNMGVRPVALDVGVTHPLRASAPHCVRANLGESGARQEDSKANLMQATCDRFGWHFRPLCFETTGAWGPGATAFLKKVAKTISLREGSAPIDIWFSVVARVQLALAKGCAEMLSKGWKAAGDGA